MAASAQHGEPDPSPPSAGGMQHPDPRVILRAYGLRPRKGLGQHFLADPGVLARIVTAAELAPDDRVLEIGPGLGVLTAALAPRAGRVVAVELDGELCRILRALFALQENVTIVQADVLTVDPGELLGLPTGSQGRVPGYKVVANLPYHITSAALRHILAARAQPERAVVMVQKEVAARILAQPGSMSVLAVSVQLYAQPTLIAEVPASAFHPAPTVDSAVLRLDVHASPRSGGVEIDRLFQVVRAGFSQKRKQLHNSLAAGLGLPGPEATAALHAAGIRPSRRAETLSLAEWSSLARVLPATGRAGEPPPR